MIQVAGNINFPGWSGVINSLQNDLTLGASSSGDVVVSQSHSLRPEIDNQQPLGRDFLRWQNLFATDGTFTNRPTISSDVVALLSDIDANGLRPVDARRVSGQIIPDANLAWGLGDIGPVSTSGFSHFAGRDLYIRNIIPYDIDNGGIGGVDILTNCSGYFVPSNTASYGVGTRNQAWQWGVFNRIIISDLIPAINPETGIGVSGGFTPLTDQIGGLGDIKSVRGFSHGVFQDLYIEGLVASGMDADGLGGAITVSGHLVPATDYGYNLGIETPSRRWGALFVGSGFIYDTISTPNFLGVLGSLNIFSSTSFTGPNNVSFSSAGTVDFDGQVDFNTAAVLFNVARPGILIAPATYSSAATLADLTNGPAIVNTINGLSGMITLTSPDSSVGININGQSIELTAPTSGFCSVHTITPDDGTIFSVAHNLNTENFVWSMWRTPDGGGLEEVTFANVAPSGSNHAAVELATEGGINGRLVIQGCGVSGTQLGNAASALTVTTSHIITNIQDAIFVNASAATSVALPNPSGKEGESVYVKNLTTNAATVHTSGSGLIDNDTSVMLDQYDTLRVMAHNGNWWIM